MNNLTPEDFVGHGLTNTPCSGIEHRQWVGRLVDVYDGDTLTCVVRLDCGDFQRLTLRVLGVDACELHAVDPAVRQLAFAARDRSIALLAADWLPAGVLPPSGSARSIVQRALDDHVCLVGLDVKGQDKYGRFLANVFALSRSGSRESLGDVLLRERLAYAYAGGQRLTEAQELDRLTAGSALPCKSTQ